MENSDAISIMSEDNRSIILNENQSQVNEKRTYLFINCFHKLIWDKRTCFFSSKKNSIENINLEFEEESNINKDYFHRIFCIQLKAGKKDSSAYLLLNYENLRNLELTEINLKEKKCFTFSDLKIKENFLVQFNNSLNNKFGNNKFNKDNYYLKLNQEQQLAIYKNYIEQTFNDNKNLMDKYSEYLAGDFINALKKSKVDELNFSTAVNLFLLSYNNKYILQFFEICNNFIYIKDDIKKDYFYNLLNDYMNKNDEFFSILSSNKSKLKFEDYTKNMNDFLITYFCLYRKDILFDDKTIAKKSKDVLFKIINNRKNIVESTKMIYDYIEVIFTMLDFNDPKNSSVKITNTRDISKFNFEEFAVHYNKVVNYQMNIRKEYFINYSTFIEKLIIRNNNILLNLEKILSLFEFELNQKSNFDKRLNLTNAYYNTIFKLIRIGNIKYEHILNFIIKCDIFKSSINSDIIITNDKFVNNYNDVLKKYKKTDILKELDILSRKGPEIIEKIKQNKIYLLFCNDMPKEYIEVFTDKINHIKYLGIFFQILPKDNYKKESIASLNDWLINNLETFSKEECNTFKEDANNFLEILIKLRDDLVENFFKNLISKLNIFCKELFLYFLNNNNVLTKKFIKLLLLYFISSNNSLVNNGSQTFENISYFVNNFTKEDDNIIEIFMNEIGYLAINEDDIFELHKTNKYKIFILLLKHKKKFIINKKGNYLNNTSSTCEEFIKRLRELKYQNIILKMTLINKTEREAFKNKIINALFFLSKEEKITKNINEESQLLFQRITDKFEEAQKIINELGDSSFYLQSFFNKKKDKMELKKEIDLFINKLWNKYLCEIDTDQNVKEKLNEFSELIKESKPILLRKKHSLLFNAIYKSNKQNIEEQNYLLEETLYNFNDALNLLKEDPNKIQDNKIIKFYYEIGITNYDSLNQEINWLITNENVDINEKQKNKILSSLKLLIKKQNIINIISGILILEKLYEKNLEPNVEEEIYFNTLKENLEILKKNISSEEIKQIINFIKKKFKEISFNNEDEKYTKYILPFFNSFNSEQNVFIFFKDIKLEEIKNLKEFLLDSDERELTLLEIDNFIQIITFLNEEINKIKNPITLIQALISGILNKNKFMDYLVIIKDYNKFKNLFDKFLKNESGIFHKIKDIINDSNFEIKFSEENNIYEITGQYIKSESLVKSGLSNIIKIKYDELSELYNRVFISSNQNENKNYIKYFVEYFRIMKKILDTINKMFFDMGYPEKILINIDIKNEMKCFYCDKEYEPQELYGFLYKNLFFYFETLRSFNNQFDEIRIFYGRQLYLINKFLKEKNFDKFKDLISCVSNGLIKNFNDNFIFNEKIGEELYSTMLNRIYSYIQRQFAFNNKKANEIYLINEIKINKNKENKNNLINIKEDDYKGLYYKPTNIEENDILNIFYVLTGSIPQNSNIIFCSKETSIPEINSFLFRVIYCQSHSLFLIFIPQYINNRQKIWLLKCFTSMANFEAKTMKSCLVILFNYSDSEFHKSLEKTENIEFIKLPYNLDFNEVKLEKEINAKIISSDICGLGKSTFINNQKNKNTQIIYLPIGGQITKDDLTKRILKAFENLKINEKFQYILHIDFTQTDNVEIVKDFLFKLIILKKIEIDENIIYIKKNIHIDIEIANDFYSYHNKFKILSLFHNPKIINSIGKLQFESNEDKENLKKVSVILASFDDGTISEKIPDFDNDYIDNPKKNKDLILKYLQIKNPNYYQIKSFIRILAFEFDKFNQCHGFFPEILKRNLKFLGVTKEESLSIRKSIVQNFINVTKHFTCGPFEDLIKIQDNTSRLVLKEKNLDKNFIQNMENQIKGITYDVIKPSLVVFNLDGGSVSILTTLSGEEQEFKNLNKKSFTISTLSV